MLVGAPIATASSPLFGCCLVNGALSSAAGMVERCSRGRWLIIGARAAGAGFGIAESWYRPGIAWQLP